MGRASGFVLLLVGIASGCGGVSGKTGTKAGGQTGQVVGPCDRFGPITPGSDPTQRPCAHAFTDHDAWKAAASGDDNMRFLVYVVPSRPAMRLPTTFVRFGVAPRHYLALRTKFPDLFPTINSAEWDAITSDSTRREFYSGPLVELGGKDGAPATYAFAVLEWPLRVPPYTSSLTIADATKVHDELRAKMPFLNGLTIFPLNKRQQAVMATWKGQPTPFKVSLDEIGPPSGGEDAAAEYQVYTEGRGYGYVRIFTLPELERAQERGEISYQDIIVVDEAPADLETVVSGIVTGSPQNLLTHLSVRTNARGTPNCYQRMAVSRFREHQNQIVHMDCTDTEVWLTPETLRDAQIWWDSLRPPPVTIPAVNVQKAPMPTLLELPTATKEERAAAMSTYGAKGTNLATLYRLVPADLQFKGFLIPAYYYDQFMRTATWTPEGATAPITFQATVEAWLKDPDFMSNTTVRVARLAALRKAMRFASVDPAALAEIRARVKATFGSEGAMVRLRSSSNAEDALEFAGAGLYDSTSACALDPSLPPTTDDAPKGDAKVKKAPGPKSRCDKASNARSLERGLTRVWASVWNSRAFEEREWSRIDHRKVGMGVLVSTRSDEERGNMVAFTGNPTSADPRYVVTAQRGDNPAVTTQRGLIAETNLISVEGGKAKEITRVVKSNVPPVGAPVVSDKELRRIAEVLAALTQTFPIDNRDAAKGAPILLDSEWKLLKDGRLVIKQVRPFLRKAGF